MGEEGEDFAGEGHICDELSVGFAQQVHFLHHFLHARGGKSSVFFNGVQGGTVVKQKLDDGAIGEHLRFPFAIAAHVNAFIKDTSLEGLVERGAVISIRTVGIHPASEEVAHGMEVSIVSGIDEAIL